MIEQALNANQLFANALEFYENASETRRPWGLDSPRTPVALEGVSLFDELTRAGFGVFDPRPEVVENDLQEWLVRHHKDLLSPSWSGGPGSGALWSYQFNHIPLKEAGITRKTLLDPVSSQQDLLT